MTKKEFKNLRIGDIIHTSVYNPVKDKIDVTQWTVERFNSNGSQVLIKNESGLQVWHGRTSIELIRE